MMLQQQQQQQQQLQLQHSVMVPHNTSTYGVEAWTPGSHHQHLVLLLTPGVRAQVLELEGYGQGRCAPLCDAAHALWELLASMVVAERVSVSEDPAMWQIQPVLHPLNPLRLQALMREEGVDGEHCMFLGGTTNAEGYVHMRALGVEVDAHRVACFLKVGAPGQAHPPPPPPLRITDPWSPKRVAPRTTGVEIPVDIPRGYDNVAMHIGAFCKGGSMLGKS